MTGRETGTMDHLSSLCSPPPQCRGRRAFQIRVRSVGQTHLGMMLLPPVGVPPQPGFSPAQWESPPSPSGRESEPMSVKHLCGPGPGSWLTWLCPVHLAVTLRSDPSALPECSL